METVRKKLKENPRDRANIFSVLVFSWVIPLFKEGFSKPLDTEDLFQTRKCDKSKILAEKLQWFWDQQQTAKNGASLLKALAKTFWREYSVLALLCLINDVVLKIAQPQLLKRFLLYFKSGSNVSPTEAMLYASGMVFLNGIGVLTINQLFMVGYYNGMKARIAVCSIIYRKALRLSHATLENTSSGTVMNLLSNDVYRFDAMSMYLNAMWTAPLLVVTVGYLLWNEVQWAGMMGLLVVFIIVPIQSYTGKLSVKFRNQTAVRTDERIRFMDEIISGVHVIKLYAWEKPFTKLITIARALELKVVQKNAYVRALYMTFAMFTTRIALFCSLLAIILLNGEQEITAAKVFVVSSYFSVIAQTLSQMFVRGLAEIVEGLVSIERIQRYLESEEKDVASNSIITNVTPDKSPRALKPTRTPSITEADTYTVCTRKMNARWVPSDPNAFNLSDINLEFRKRGRLIGVTGPIGSGKSSLLQAFLRELPTECGNITVNGKLSYASQEPWVFASSIRQNILFGEKMDRRRYEMVVKACDLEKDFLQLEYGDQTLIGQKAMLSTGQFSRINLARSVYRKADIYLLDDPLSAVDNHVQIHLFTDCIGPKGILAKEKATRILVTHQIHFLKNVDWLIVMDSGKIMAQGHPAELSSIEFPPIHYETTDEQNPPNNENHLRRRKISRISSKSLSMSLSSLNSEYEGKRRDSEFDPCLIESVQFYEENANSEQQHSSLIGYFLSGAKMLKLFIILLLFILAQLSASLCDYWVSFWTSQEEARSTDNRDNLLSTKSCIIVYSTLIAMLFLITITRSISFYSVCIKASRNLHDNMFNALLSTNMRFYNINPPGRIMNRFSRDIGAVDESLPKVLLDSIQTNLNMCGAIILTAFVNPIVLIPLTLLSIMFWFVRSVYLKTSKSLKRLESVNRSPIYTHLSVSLAGLSTIRAFNAENILIEEFDNHQDTHAACWYAFISTSCAFGFALDAMCFILVFIVIFSFLLLHADAVNVGISGDKVGLAVTQSMTMTSLLQWGIRHSCEVANQLISVERILEYGGLEPERQPTVQKEVLPSWPNNGHIEFRNVTYRYAYEAEPVLQGISFELLPKTKTCVVGRTGAGKSSLVGALFRMAYVKGEIFIDGVDTSSIELQLLRSKISIIPQTPLIVSGTLRQNLDPFNEYTDDEIYSALDDIKMRHIASGNQGLELTVLANGANFSNGQRQILCLARAILKKNTILILDEPSASLDPHTDELIQQTIRSKFANCTIFTIAHRLNTIIDYDRVLVIDGGRLVEFDTPYNLLMKSNGYFKEMVQALGNKEFERFVEIAKTKTNQ